MNYDDRLVEATHRDIIAPIEDILDAARNGKMFILVDHEDRENEGDLVIPAQMATRCDQFYGNPWTRIDLFGHDIGSGG